MLLFVSMYRGDTVGTDTINYINNVSMASGSIDVDMEEERTLEIAYTYIIDFLSSHQLPEYYIIIIFSICTFLGLWLAARQLDVSSSLLCTFFLVMGFYSLSLNIARQLVAIAFLMVAIGYLLNDNKKGFLLYAFIATSFHLSSILVLVLYPCSLIKLPKYISYIGVLIAFVVGISLSKSDTVMKVINILSDRIFYFEHYTESIEEATSLSFMGYLYKAIGLVLFSLIYFYQKDYKSQTSKIEILFIISLIIDYLFVSLGDIASRILILFKAIQLIYLCLFFQKNIKQSHYSTILYIVFILYFSYSTLSSLSNDSGEILNYELREF